MEKEKKESGPQIENGHIDIANELVEALAKTYLSSYESRILWALWRMTWGYVQRDKEGKTIYIVNKKGHSQPLKLERVSISSKKWIKLTGLDKGNISRTLKRLCKRNIVTQIGNKYKSITWGFQKHYSKWVREDFVIQTNNKNIVIQTNNNLLSKQTTPVVQTNNKIITKPLQDKAELDTKENFLKKTYIKKEKKDDIYNLETEEKTEEKEIFDYWNSLNIIEHKTFKLFEKDIRESLKNYPLEEIKNTIKNYSLILKDEKYYYDFEHTISGFLEPKNFERFKDLERAKRNYQVKRLNNEIDKEDYNIPQYQLVEPIKETEEERKIRYEKSAKRMGDLRRELNEKKGD